MSTYLDFLCATCGSPATRLGTEQGSLACDEHVKALVGARHVELNGFDRDFWNYELEVRHEGELTSRFRQSVGLHVYRCLDPAQGGGVMQSFDLSFVGSQVILHGDLCPGRRTHDNKGVISVGGQDREWFIRATSEHYLAEKFGLERVFRPDHAAEHLRELADEENDGERSDELRDLASEAEGVSPNDEHDVQRFLSAYQDLGYDSDFDWCFGVDPHNMALLGAIQRRFRFLMLARRAAP